MCTLSRHVLCEFIKIFVVAITAMTLLMIIVGVVREGAEEGLGLSQILQIIPYILPDALRFTVPGTVLFAACSLYGRMAGANEVVAIKSLGISPMSILWPVFILAFMLSLTTVWLNDLAVSWGRNGVRRVVIEAVEEIVYGMLKVQRSYSASKLSITVKSVEDRRLMQPILTLQSDSRIVTITADEAELKSDNAASALLFSCRNAVIDVDGQVTARLDTCAYKISLDQASQQEERSGSPSWMPLSEIAHELSEIDGKIDKFQQEIATQAAYDLLTGDFDALVGSEWKSRNRLMLYHIDQRYRLRAEPQRRWSNGFSCLCFVLVGAPMAIRLRNADFLKSFFACFLPILIVYYPFLVYFVDQAKAGSMPPYLVWVGNVILVAWGLWMLRKVMRY